MFCQKCGCQVQDGVQNCPNCGTPMNNGGFNASSVEAQTKAALDNAGNEFINAINDVKNNISGNAAPYTGERLQTDRSLLTYILLSIVTCGIYGYYFIYKMAKDVNIACSGDGEETQGLLIFILLSMVTCGLYAWFWYYKLGNRLAANAPRYGMQFKEDGTTVLLWCLIGIVVCGIGPYIAMYYLIQNTNKICDAYNRMNHL